MALRGRLEALRERFRRWKCRKFGHKPGRWEKSCVGLMVRFCKRCDVLVETRSLHV